jgi:bifunctional non-homologous end joining protein LigD
MLATPGERPVSPGWAYEFKWDGVRAIVRVDRDGLVIAQSRNDRDLTASYPELRDLGALAAGRRLTLDGELVALDDTGAPSFSRLQQRLHVVAPSPSLVARVPVRLYVFDVLFADDRPTLGLPYERRRELLTGLGLDGGAVATPPSWDGAEGEDVMAAAVSLGLEGVVAKRLDSVYEPGVRARSWVKTPFNRTVEVVVGGWTPGAGRRLGAIGALLLGLYDDQGILRYVGQVGTGFTQQTLADLQRLLTPLEVDRPPFGDPVPRAQAGDAHWVSPLMVGEVAYRTVTPDRRLRHPAWRGLRPDREPAEARLSNLEIRGA